MSNKIDAHAGDCTIYSALINGTPMDGICTCGYGRECERRGDFSQKISNERLQAMLFGRGDAGCPSPWATTRGGIRLPGH